MGKRRGNEVKLERKARLQSALLCVLRRLPSDAGGDQMVEAGRPAGGPGHK